MKEESWCALVSGTKLVRPNYERRYSVSPVLVAVVINSVGSDVPEWAAKGKVVVKEGCWQGCCGDGKECLELLKM